MLLMAGLFGGGGEQANADIHDEITISEDGVDETIEIDIHLEGANDEVEKAALDYKTGGNEQAAASMDADEPSQGPRL